MPKTRKPYPPEFREQMVALVRAGRTPEELSREFEPTAQSIINWVAQGDRDEGKRKDGLTSAEREELRRLAGRLVQPAPAPFRTRLLVTHQLRQENVIKSCLGPKP